MIGNYAEAYTSLNALRINLLIKKQMLAHKYLEPDVNKGAIIKKTDYMHFLCCYPPYKYAILEHIQFPFRNIVQQHIYSKAIHRKQILQSIDNNHSRAAVIPCDHSDLKARRKNFHTYTIQKLIHSKAHQALLHIKITLNYASKIAVRI